MWVRFWMLTFGGRLARSAMLTVGGATGLIIGDEMAAFTGAFCCMLAAFHMICWPAGSTGLPDTSAHNRDSLGSTKWILSFLNIKSLLSLILLLLLLPFSIMGLRESPIATYVLVLLLWLRLCYYANTRNKTLFQRFVIIFPRDPASRIFTAGVCWKRKSWAVHYAGIFQLCHDSKAQGYTHTDDLVWLENQMVKWSYGNCWMDVYSVTQSTLSEHYRAATPQSSSNSLTFPGISHRGITDITNW